MNSNQRHAYLVFLSMKGMDWFIFSLVVTVLDLYLATEVIRDPFRLMLIGTSLTATIILLEIPTGLVADTYGRKLSVIIGYALIGCAAIIVGTFQRYEIILLSQVIWGADFTFISGAGDAWIADEIGEEKLGAAYLRGSQISQIVLLIGIPVSTAFGTRTVNLPY